MFQSPADLDFILMYHLYGLAFFSMGLAMALEAGRSPRLAEARILRPLAVFGILHGVHEWLELYTVQSMVQEAALPKSFMVFRLAVLAISFASLIAFGVQALRPRHRLIALDAQIGGAMILLYVSVIGVSHLLPWQSPPNCLRCADALARYLLAVPGGILAAFALRHQARQVKAGKGHPDLVRCLTASAWGFSLYALSQVFVGPAEIWPAPLLNSGHFQEATGIPIQLFRSIFAIFITYHLIRATQIVDRERQQEYLDMQEARLKAMERAEMEAEKRRNLQRMILRNIVLAQEEERTRISRELHDETAQILTAASLNIASLAHHVKDSPEASLIIERSQLLCKEMATTLRRLVHDLRPAQLDDLGLAAALEHLADEYRQNHGLKVRLTLDTPPARLDPLAETVLYRVTQEALTNVARHAETDSVSVHLYHDLEQVTLEVRDHGRGFASDKMEELPGLGIAGMRERVEAVGGVIHIDTTPGEGTLVEVNIPLEKESDTAKRGSP